MVSATQDYYGSDGEICFKKDSKIYVLERYPDGSWSGVGHFPSNKMGPKVPEWVPKDYVEIVTAEEDYEAKNDNELNLTKGEVIYVLSRKEEGRSGKKILWKGIKGENGKTGLFPRDYGKGTLFPPSIEDKE